MTKTEMIHAANDLICTLKAAAELLKCQQQNACLEQQATQNQPKSHTKPPVCEGERKQLPRNMPKKCQALKKTYDSGLRNEECTQKYKSPEMKNSYLHYKCFCLHRNGLQDDCPLTGCKGSPACMAKPWAECVPGKYYRAKNPELYPPGPSESKKKC